MKMSNKERWAYMEGCVTGFVCGVTIGCVFVYLCLLM